MPAVSVTRALKASAGIAWVERTEAPLGRAYHFYGATFNSSSRLQPKGCQIPGRESGTQSLR